MTALTAQAILAHEQWLRAGRSGEGRLELAGGSATKARVGAALLSGARLAEVDLRDSDLESVRLDGAELRETRFDDARLSAAVLREATITRCVFEGAHLALAKLERARVETTDFRSADLDTSRWDGARVTASVFAGATFGNAVLDGAVFTRCDLRGARLGLTGRKPPATTRGTRFEDCDLRDSDWTGRDLSGATFVRCTLSGSRGAPLAADGLVLEDSDLTSAGWLARLSGEVNSPPMTRTQRAVTFEESGDARYPYQATVDGARWQVRINEFPEEPSLYSLLVDGEVVEELAAWPAAWSRPLATSTRPPAKATSEDDPHERAEHEREQARFERTRHISPSKLVK